MVSPIELPNVNDVVYQVLREKILQGELATGQQLNLRELETQLAVSRSPLKMALARLQAEGLVTIHPRRGTYVTQFDATDIAECFEIRIALEAQALRSAFEPQNAATIQTALELLAEMDSYFSVENTWMGEVADFMELDRKMHLALVAFSRNNRLQKYYMDANLQGYIAIMGSNFHYEDVLKTQHEHRAIAQALTGRDTDALLLAARGHLEGAKARALRRLAYGETVSATQAQNAAEGMIEGDA